MQYVSHRRAPNSLLHDGFRHPFPTLRPRCTRGKGGSQKTVFCFGLNNLIGYCWVNTWLGATVQNNVLFWWNSWWFERGLLTKRLHSTKGMSSTASGIQKGWLALQKAGWCYTIRNGIQGFRNDKLYALEILGCSRFEIRLPLANWLSFWEFLGCLRFEIRLPLANQLSSQ